MALKTRKIDAFNLSPGRIIGGKYEVLTQLGQGWEGEVYQIRELSTGITRAAKLFYPQRNTNNKTSIAYARMLHKLNTCHMVMQYSAAETLTFQRQPIMALISEYIEGIQLTEYLAQQPGKRLPPFQAVHLLHALTVGVEELHQIKEYHGDLHSSNIIVQRVGLTYDIKVLDMMRWRDSRSANIKEDTINLIHIFYEALGGQKHYAKQPQAIKEICCGLKRSLIQKKFRHASALRNHLESFAWE